MQVEGRLESTRFNSNLAWFLFILGILYATYFIVSLGGQWTENDTSVFIAATKETLLQKNVLFAGQYPHGFGYPAWLGSLSLLTGISVGTCNTLVAPFIGVTFLVSASFLAYRTLLRHEVTAALGTILLFALPDVMFTVLRGNHEKLNVLFALTDYFVLFKGFQAVRSRNNAEIVTWVVIYYALVFSNTATNDYFGSTVVFVSLLTVAFLLLLFRIRRRFFHVQSVAARFAVSIATSWLLIWLIMLFIFPEDGQDFLLLQNVSTQVQDLFLSLAPSSDPYAIANQQWVSPLIGYLTGLSRDLLIGGSFLWFTIQVYRLLRIRRLPAASEVFLIAAYFAYAALIVVSVPIDLLGLAAGSNLEVRNFNYFALLASPLAAWGLQALRTFARIEGGKSRLRELRYRLYPFLNFSMGLTVVALIGFGMLKASLSPTISNLWMFYTPAESQTLAYFNARDRSASIWTGPDNRLVNLFQQQYPLDAYGNIATGFGISSHVEDRDILWSPVVAADVIENGYPIPLLNQMNEIYDNGDAEIYRLAPESPLEN